MECWKYEIMEYWNNGVMGNGKEKTELSKTRIFGTQYPNTPLLHCSSTPILRFYHYSSTPLLQFSKEVL
jgi:hypothetical protein